MAAFKEDTAPQKVNLAQGAYRTDAGTPFVLASVKEAERRVAADLRDGRSDKEYLPIEGHAAFRRLSAELVLGGESPSLRDAAAGIARRRVHVLVDRHPPVRRLGLCI